MIDCSSPPSIMVLPSDPVVPHNIGAVFFRVLWVSFSKRNLAGLLAPSPVERRGNAAHVPTRGNPSHVTALLF